MPCPPLWRKTGGSPSRWASFERRKKRPDMEERGSAHPVLTTASAEETRRLGIALAALLRPGDVVLLVGELGAGKTCLAQGIANGLGIAERVTSPTFTLLREYEGSPPLYHLDAYRLDGPGDLAELGIEEYLDGDGILLVEWGDRVRGFFGGDMLEVTLEFSGGDRREVCLAPLGEDWESRIAAFTPKGGRDG